MKEGERKIGERGLARTRVRPKPQSRQTGACPDSNGRGRPGTPGIQHYHSSVQARITCPCRTWRKRALVAARSGVERACFCRKSA